MTESRPVLGTPEEIAASDAPVLTPWRRVLLDEAYGGRWVVAGDVDGDGEVEVVSAQNYNENDVHHTTTAVAQKLDGTVLWRWGDPTVGRKALHHDVACQIYDWDGDGHNEVIVAADGALVHLDGATGAVRRRIPIPRGASDCVAFARLSGGERADVLVKTRYTDVWAYTYAGDLLWHVHMPGGYRTAHQARPIDIDGDGRDEVMAGYALLNPDGSVRWVYESRAVSMQRGHLDAMRVVRAGERPEEWRLALTLCSGNNLALIDGTGRIVWELPGRHFESIDVGRFCPGVEGVQLAIDIAHGKWGDGPICVVDEAGREVSEWNTVYSRDHCLVGWGDGEAQSLAIGEPRGLFDCVGRRLATFDLSLPDGIRAAETDPHVAAGDMTGDGVPDLIYNTERAAYIFRNPAKATGAVADAELGTGPNYTYY
jgi:hypothetical protein